MHLLRYVIAICHSVDLNLAAAAEVEGGDYVHHLCVAVAAMSKVCFVLCFNLCPF